MRIGVYIPEQIPESFRVYYRNVSRYLKNQVELVEFKNAISIPDNCSLMWDIRSGGGHIPPDFLLESSTPLVVTVHGVAPLAIPLREYCATWRSVFRGVQTNKKKRQAWNNLILNDTVPTLIAVSHYGKKTICEELGVPEKNIHVCHHGVDHDLFNTQSNSSERDYFLHISNGEKRKNIDRIVAAYRSLNYPGKKRLLLKVPESIQQHMGACEGLEYITDRLSDEGIRDLYAGAYAFLFPSLYEGFGLPVLESMACGTPVITSEDSACSEVGGSAAVIVNPRSVNQISQAMKRLGDDFKYHSDLSKASVQQASLFSWSKSAEDHLAVFINTMRKVG